MNIILLKMLILMILIIIFLIFPLFFVCLLLLGINYLNGQNTCKEVKKYLRPIDSKLAARVDISVDGGITIDGIHYWEMNTLDYKVVANNLLLMDRIELGIINANKLLDFKQIWQQIMRSDGLTYIDNNDYEKKKKEIDEYFENEKYSDDLIEYYQYKQNK